MHKTPVGNSARGQSDCVCIYIYIYIYHKTLDKWATKTAEFFPTVSNET